MTEAAVQPVRIGQETEIANAQQAGQRAVVFGPVMLFVLAASAMGLSFSGMLPFTLVIEAWPAVNLALVVVVALAAGLIHAYTFAAISAVRRRGEANQEVAAEQAHSWMLSGRALRSPLAFASSGVLAVFLALGSGVILGSLLQETLPLFARGLSILFGNQWLLNNLSAITSQEGLALFGTLGVLLVFLLLFVSPRVTVRVLLFGLVLTAVAWIIIAVQLASGTPYDFQLAWDKFMGTGVFVYQLKEARRLGMQAGFQPHIILAAGASLAMLIFSGYFFPAYFAPEIQAPRKHLLRSSLLAVLTFGGLLLVGVFLAQRLIPLEWFSVQAAYSHLPQYYSSTLPWLPFYAALLHPNPVLFWLVGIGWLFSLFCLALVMAYAASRIVRGWADGGFLPDVVRFIHPELHSPLIAVLLVSILAEAGLVAFAMGFNTKYWLPLAVGCAQLFPVLALIALPYRQKALFEQSGRLVNRRLGPVPLVTITGSLSLLFLLAMIVFLLFTPTLGGLYKTAGLGLVVVFALGVGWYFATQPYRGQTAQNTGD